jgi:hypothetical protein
MTDAQARYWARRAGWRCLKARGKQHINNMGGYMIVNENNCVVAGERFHLTADCVVALSRAEVYSLTRIADQVITIKGKASNE